MCLNSVKNSLSHPLSFSLPLLFLSLSLTPSRSLSPPSLSVNGRLTIVLNCDLEYGVTQNNYNDL